MKKRVMKAKERGHRITRPILMLSLLLFFVLMFVWYGPGVYNDSEQYIGMHIHREPLYPLFLKLLRDLFGENYLYPMGVLQNIFMAVSIFLLTKAIGDRFRLSAWMEAVVACIQVFPHIMTKYCSATGLFITNSVMSEALTMPLCTLWILNVLNLMWTGKKRNAAGMWMLSLLLSLTRSQMMVTILIAMLVMVYRVLFPATEKSNDKALLYSADGIDPENKISVQAKQSENCRKSGNQRKYEQKLEQQEQNQDCNYRQEQSLRQKKQRQLGKKCLRVALTLLITAVTFTARLYIVKTYNLIYNGAFINNTYGNVSLVTNMIYASDREEGEAIQDEQTRAFFYEIFDKAWEIEANYSFAGTSLTDRAQHIEQKHDDIKFNCIEDTFYQYYDNNVTTDYITQNLLADEQAMKIMKAIFPRCLKNWLFTYCGIVYYGLVRSIALVHPVVNIIAVVIYIMAMVLTIILWKRNPKSPAIPMMCLALLFIVGNATEVALTIMCLSRYMIYGFAWFYMALLMVIIELLRTRFGCQQ